MTNVNSNYLLAIESAISGGSIALFRDGHFVNGASEGNAVSRAEDLLPRVIDLLSKAGTQRKELSRVAVSLGPGSYTGLRIGISTVMGLCRGLQIGYVGVPLFKAIASCFDESPSLIALPMGRSDICVADTISRETLVTSLDKLRNDLDQRESVRLLVHSDLADSLGTSCPNVVNIGTNLAKFIGVNSLGLPNSTSLDPFYIQNPRFV